MTFLINSKFYSYQTLYALGNFNLQLFKNSVFTNLSVADVQDCDGENDLTSYRNVMNPCLYGACVIDTFPNASFLKYLRCNCILQYTGEFCTGNP